MVSSSVSRFFVAGALNLAVAAISGGSVASAEGIATSARFFDGTIKPIAIAIQADGRIVAVGTPTRHVGLDDIPAGFALMRFNRDGSPDDGFGTGGRVTTIFPGGNFARALAIQPDGKIIVAGTMSVSITLPGVVPPAACPCIVPSRVALARYTPAGALDVTFGTGGIVVQDYQPGETEQDRGFDPTAITVAPTGDILVAAKFQRTEWLGGFPASTSYPGLVPYWQLQRFAADGTRLPNWDVYPKFLSLHPFAFVSGARLIAASSSTVRRYTAAGTLDPAFGTAGVASSGGTSTDEMTINIGHVTGMVVGANDNVTLAFGRTIARLTPSGARDTSFGQGGSVTGIFAPYPAMGELRALAEAPDGTIVAAGSSGVLTWGGGDFQVLTTTAAGAIRQSLTTDFGGVDWADEVAVLADGTILAAGFSGKPDRTDVAWTELVSSPWRPLLPSATPIDFDGDRKADMVALAATGEWRIALSSTGFAGRAAYRWGAPTDVPLVADFNGDRRTDLAVFRQTTNVTGATWYLIDPLTYQQSAVSLGGNGHVPVPGDYNGDGRTDAAIWQPVTGDWFIGNYPGASVARLGRMGDIPIPRDFDGDGRTDLAVYTPSTGIWRVFNLMTGVTSTYQWGLPGDIPVPADYSGKGYMAIAVYRPTTGDWWIYDPGTGQFSGTHWGAPGDVPVPGDYIGDRRTDLAVFRPATGAWFVHDLTTGAFFPVGLGAPTEPPAR